MLYRQLCVVSGGKAKVENFSSVGLDGAMVIWTFKVLVSDYVSNCGLVDVYF